MWLYVNLFRLSLSLCVCVCVCVCVCARLSGRDYVMECAGGRVESRPAHRVKLTVSFLFRKITSGKCIQNVCLKP